MPDRSPGRRGAWLAATLLLVPFISHAAAPAGADDLAHYAAQTPDSASQLFTLTSQPFYLTADDTEPAGTLMPAVELAVVARTGDKVQAKLSGWQQEGADSVLYAAAGKRILSASLAPAARPLVSRLSEQQDAASNQLWRQVVITVWLPKAALIEDRQKIWQVAANDMSANCGGCHSLVQPGRFTANQWIGVMRGMAPRTALDKEQIRLLTRYVQLHASDMPAADPQP